MAALPLLGREGGVPARDHRRKHRLDDVIVLKIEEHLRFVEFRSQLELLEDTLNPFSRLSLRSSTIGFEAPSPTTNRREGRENLGQARRDLSPMRLGHRTLQPPKPHCIPGRYNAANAGRSVRSLEGVATVGTLNVAATTFLGFAM
ncbi:MAG: hypothetical protein ABI488_00470 [Polyangiaceae bacterium]